MYILNEFYVGLDEKIIYGSKCSKCGKVYFPAIIRCQDCLEDTDDLIELPQTGILKNFINSSSNSKKRKKKKDSEELLYGLIQIDNSDTPVIMLILNAKKANLKPGMKVKVVWGDGKLTKSPHIVGFEPVE